MTKSVWETLSVIDVSRHVEKKNGFSYLSWPYAWATLKEHYPHATCTKHMNLEEQIPFWRDKNTGNCFVVVTVEINDEDKTSATETYPVLNHANRPIENPNAFDINTALQRGMVKAIAMLGLGHYIYAGEDLPPTPKEADVEGTTVKGYENIRSMLEGLLPSMTTDDDLEQLWKRNAKAVQLLKKDAPMEYQGLLAKFKMRKKEIADG